MLTIAQLQTLKALALADPIASGYITSGNDSELANWLNADTTWIVWRAALSPDQARAAIVAGASQLDALTAGKRDALLYITQGSLDTSSASVRAAIDDLCGSQNILKTALQAAQKRTASRAEKALSSGTGTTVSPATLGWEGQISYYADAPLIREA